MTRSAHEVEFCSDDAAFVFGFTRFIEAALQAGNAVIVIATESHRNRLLQRLQEHGVDIAAAIEQGRYVSLDVAETLSTFMVNDLPDPVRFFRVAGDLTWRQPGNSGGTVKGCNLRGMRVNLVGARQGGCGYSGGAILQPTIQKIRNRYSLRVLVEQLLPRRR